VVEAHGLGCEHRTQALALGRNRGGFFTETAPEVWGENFNAGLGVASANGRHGFCKEAGTVVGEVVAGDGGKHHIPQPHGGYCRGDPLCFQVIEGGWGLTLFDLAKGTTAGANRPP
jgi:hypothetical protein